MKKLSDILITSVDLCRRGANPRAKIRLAKQAQPDSGAADDTAYKFLCALRDSLISILDDESLSDADKLDKIYISADELTQAIEQVPGIADEAEDRRFAATPPKEAGFAKAMSENALLRKQLELAQLSEVARRYAPLGRDTEQLAQRLYKLSQTGDEDYQDYIGLLDELLETERTGALFTEMGSGRKADGSALEAAVKRVMAANPGMSRADAVVMAYRLNPGLPETL